MTTALGNRPAYNEEELKVLASNIDLEVKVKQIKPKSNPVPVIIPEDPIEDMDNSTQNVEIRVALNQVKSFAQLRPIVRKVEVHFSFLGNRYITVKGYKGFLSIDALAKKVQELIEINPHFDEAERAYGKTIAGPIDDIYIKSDEQVDEGHWFTYLLVNIQRIIVNILAIGRERSDHSETRWNWRECEFSVDCHGDHFHGFYKVFCCYTRVQYQNIFDEEPTSNSNMLKGLKECYWLIPGNVWLIKWAYGDSKN